MAFTLEGSASAMHPESQMFSVPVTFTERWKVEHDRLHPTATLADGTTTGDMFFYIPPSTTVWLFLKTLHLNWSLVYKNKDVEHCLDEAISFSYQDGFVLFEQEKDLITGVPVTIRFVMAKPEFYLRKFDSDLTKQFRIVIKNPRLRIRRNIPAPDYLISTTEELQSKPCKYHVERTVIRVTDIPRSTQSTVISNLQIGQLPKICLIGFVDSKDFHGDSTRSPFLFDHFGLQQISCEVDGQSFPGRPYTAEFDKFQSLECYEGLLETFEKRHDPHGEFWFDREDYAGGYTLFGSSSLPQRRSRCPLLPEEDHPLLVAVWLISPFSIHFPNHVGWGQNGSSISFTSAPARTTLDLLSYFSARSGCIAINHQFSTLYLRIYRLATDHQVRQRIRIAARKKNQVELFPTNPGFVDLFWQTPVATLTTPFKPELVSKSIKARKAFNRSCY
ncbi:hypothetical protein BV898_06553 [Hypsibius exemplaris]|uniref:Uncharacterized protein n=1 Tax=Hypsibius exemplaris TaxID=2072580 RepID=A0A1W0WW62_HYPEX|nr:hypothetical protein BV898_06553 [Hypsibius exemplaris]